jgi:hypothetical protein
MHRYRITFLTGLAAGFVVGTRAGRERYEQMKKLARNAADSPAVQQAAGAVQAQATEKLKSASHKVTDQLHERVPRMAKSAKQKVGDRVPGRRGKDAGAKKSGANGSAQISGERPFAAASGRSGGRKTS